MCSKMYETKGFHNQTILVSLILVQLNRFTDVRCDIFRDVVKDMKAHFMGDLTIPDGTKVQPGTKFVKTWKIKNSGNISWRESTKVHVMNTPH